MVRLLFSFFLNVIYTGSWRPVEGLLKASFRRLGGLLESFGRSLGSLWGVFGPSWRHLDRFIAQEASKEGPKSSPRQPQEAPECRLKGPQ